MFQRIAARPLALTAALLLFPACDSGGDGTDTDTDASTSGTTEPGTTSGAGTTTTASGSTTTDPSTTGVAESGSTGLAESSTGEEESSSGEESGSSSSGGLTGIAEITGTYIETWGAGKSDFFPHEVAADSWTIDFGTGMSVLTYEEIDDDVRWVAGSDGPGSYTRYDWDFDTDGNLRYCSAIIAAATLQEAVDAPASDRDDFDVAGCAGAFPWSLLELE